jgi:hypothetical protein
MFKLIGGMVSKYLIAVVFLLGLAQGKSEALDLDAMVMIKEVAAVSNKYKKCTDVNDDKKRLKCFDNLTNYIKEREKKYENLLSKEKGDRHKLIDGIDNLANRKRGKK